MPPAVDETEQLHCVKLLGVLFQYNLKMDSHVQNILSQCAQRMYLLKLLQHQGMPLNKLRVVVYSLIVSRIAYNNNIIIQHLYSAIVSYAGCRGAYMPFLLGVDLYLLNLRVRLMQCLRGSGDMVT